MTTASRSRGLMVRVQNIEASLPPLEKAVLAQTSHIHFAYTAGMVLLGNDLTLCIGLLEILCSLESEDDISFLNGVALRNFICLWVWRC